MIYLRSIPDSFSDQIKAAMWKRQLGNKFYLFTLSQP